MICGNCKDRHATVAEVRECYTQSRDFCNSPHPDSPAAQSPHTPALPTLAVEPVEGFYTRDGFYYKVVQSESTGRFYAYEGEPFPDRKIDWVYAGRRPLHNLTAAHRLNAEQAAQLGHLTGRCVFCSRKLTDDRSTEVGYGPICADREGLPWGL